MRVSATVDGNLRLILADEVNMGEQAVSGAVSRLGAAVKAAWRGQVASAGLGTRLSNSIRHEVYPKGRPSLNAAALIFTKAPKIIAAFEGGALIVGKSGNWLAIPLPAAGTGKGGAKITPYEWEQRSGLDLRFVYRPGRPSLLVAEGRLSVGRRAGLAKRKGGKRRMDGLLTGETTIPVFLLLPQVRLSKRLDLIATAERIGSGLPGNVVSGWR